MKCGKHKMRSDLSGCPFCLEEKHKALQAENKKLRGALEKIPKLSMADYKLMYKEAVLIAKAALGVNDERE